ncbi:MAG TPA: hypothetical protein VEK33_24180, partial [Terriglobales bacterium]|nr:hypothetical protein [Terriglobales bacterium]
TRLTFSQANTHNRLPLWSPDGSQIVFSSDRDGHSSQIYEKAVNGTDKERLVSPGVGDRYPASWSPDRRYVAGVQQNPQRGTQFLILSVEGTQRPMDFLPAAIGISRYTFPRISPNGKWIAYCSYESGENELYLTSFPSGSGKWQVSTNGGRSPVWRRDGRELFYATPDLTFMAVEFSEDHDSPVIGKARPLFRIRAPISPQWYYDVAPDGKRFLINSLQQPASPEPLTLLVNWDAELKKK